MRTSGLSGESCLEAIDAIGAVSTWDATGTVDSVGAIGTRDATGIIDAVGASDCLASMSNSRRI
jgi:hypothetical protein